MTPRMRAKRADRVWTRVALAAFLVVAAAVPGVAQKPAYDPSVEPVARAIFQELMSPY